MKKYLQNGFTLIELLVVIAIIGVLASLIVANFNAARERARDTARKSDLRNTQTALRAYYNDYGNFPNDSGISTLKINGCGSLGMSTCEWGDTFTAAVTQVYMTVLPGDPQASTGRQYQYDLTADTEVYELSACLENATDVACLPSSQTPQWCKNFKGCLYRVKP